jgi:hypothetical protein
VEIARERVAIALEPTARVLSIDNPHGEIRVRVGAPGEVGIVALL